MEIYSETRNEQKNSGKQKKNHVSKTVASLFQKMRVKEKSFAQKMAGKNVRHAQGQKSALEKASEKVSGGSERAFGGTAANRAAKAFRSADVSRVVGKMNEKIASVSALSGRMKKIALFVGVCVVVGVCAALFVSFRTSYQHTERATFLSADEQSYLDSILDETYTLQRSSALKPLPYPVSPVELDVWAGSAILVDASNGCVIFEKNADTPIPPASITKLFVMYVVFKDIHAGKFSLDDIVPLPEKSWAVNMPADASLMFLGQGQIVTLRELLLGLAVASGNDAAIAVARYISGGTDEFVKRMNDECAALGLTSTRFVEPSGYDENNMTTARDLATFSRIYINTYPESIEMFHSAKSIRYPLEKNLPSWQKGAGDSRAIYQKNTNPLLGEMEGVDGIKTGFIYESGYNLALTAKRNGNRFISITLQGPGRGSKQGNEGRVHDGHEMMDFAFASFADYNPDSHIQTSYPVAVPGGKEKFVRLVPAWKNAITVPHIAGGESANDDANAVRAVVTMPKSIYGGVVVAKQYGQIQYKLGDVVLETVPLVSDRSVERGGLWKRFWGFWI